MLVLMGKWRSLLAADAAWEKPMRICLRNMELDTLLPGKTTPHQVYFSPGM